MTSFEDLLRERVQAWQPSAELADLDPLTGGRSGHTWRARLRTGGVDRPVVLKAGAPGRPVRGRHDMARQARAMAALAGVTGVAVPEVLAVLDGDPQVMITSWLPGDCREPTMDGVDGLPDGVIRPRAVAAARTLARLHQVDIARLGADEPVSTLGDEVERWGAVMQACDPDVVAGSDAVIAALAATVPADLAPVLVHGDFRLGNLLCDDGEVRGIIDWEIWTLTDPRVDLGWFLLFADREDWPGVAGAMGGMPSAAELLANYESVAGSMARMGWFMPFARMKMAAITAHNLQRHRDGRRPDPTQERFTRMIARMLERARQELAS